MILRRASRNMLLVWGGLIGLMGVASMILAIVHSDGRYLALGAGLLAVGLLGISWLRRVDLVEDWQEGFDAYKRQHEESQE